MRDKKCKVCSKQFSPKHPAEMTCSEECKELLYKESHKKAVKTYQEKQRLLKSK